MRISRAAAKQIVEEIGKVVKQNINLMDETGHIVASNDPSRIGDFHEGAYQIIQNHLEEFYITPEMERTMKLVRQGINLPIEVDGVVEGVVGITGVYDEVIRYGQVVKKMAEILVRERIAMDIQRQDQRVRRRFLEDWILRESPAGSPSLVERGYAVGIDIRTPRRCMVISVRHPERFIHTLEGQQLLENLQTAVGDILSRVKGCIILPNVTRQILLVPRRSTEELEALGAMVLEQIRDQLKEQLLVGIDGGAADVHTAYLQANRAWLTAAHSKSGIISYGSLNTELILDDVPKKRKVEYLHKIFRDCGPEEIQEFVVLLEAYFAAEGSLSVAAEMMFIHKNTLQYRLRRLAEITGLDVRKPSNTPALYMAVMFFRDLESSGENVLPG